MPDPFALEAPLCKFGPKDQFTIGDACTGFHIFGGTGSGKTSGSGKFISRHMLKAGFGGLVLTFKPDEAENWIDLAKEAGREVDILRIQPGSDFRFDFMVYEQERSGDGAGRTVNIIHQLGIALEMMNPESDGGGGDEGFWRMASNELLTSIIDLLKAAGEQITITNILSLIGAIPFGLETKQRKDKRIGPDGNEEEVTDYDFSFDGDPNARTHPFYDVYHKAMARGAKGALSDIEQQDAGIALQYLLAEFSQLSDRTRTSIQINATTSLFSMVRGDIGRIFASGMPDDPENAFHPERCFDEGKIIILDIPVSEWGVIGRVAQGLYKYVFQKALDRRNTRVSNRPVFLWADEAQNFINKYDPIFLTTARSTRCSTVYLTQNIENYFAIIGEHRTKSFLGNFQTKIFHQNTDISTNAYGSNMIGEYWTTRKGQSFSQDQGSFSKSQDRQKRFDPEGFNSLRTGGMHNDLIVEALLFSGIKRFVAQAGTGAGQGEELPFKLVSFKQG